MGNCGLCPSGACCRYYWNCNCCQYCMLAVERDIRNATQDLFEEMNIASCCHDCKPTPRDCCGCLCPLINITDVDKVADLLRSNSSYGAEDAGIHELLGFLHQHMAKQDGYIDRWEFEEIVFAFYLKTGVKEMQNLNFKEIKTFDGDDWYVLLGDEYFPCKISRQFESKSLCTLKCCPSSLKQDIVGLDIKVVDSRFIRWPALLSINSMNSSRVQGVPSWRLFIDGNRQTNDAFIFNIGDDHYIENLVDAWEWLLTKTPDALSPDFIRVLHGKSLGLQDDEKSMFCKTDTFFSVKDFGNWNGLQELHQRNVFYEDMFGFPLGGFLDDAYQTVHIRDVKESLKDQSSLLYYAQMCKNAEEFISYVTKTFISEFDLLINNDKKLKRTLQFVQDLERAHLFEDANLRTFAMLLFNWILIIWLHQSPMIWFDPNNLDLFSISELTSSVQKGQRVFQEIKTRLSFRKHLKCRVRDLGF